MRSIRRLYLYTTCLVSLEVVLWGIIGLLRSLFAGGEIGGGSVDRLAGALALIFVGIPVFMLHWWLVQRSIRNEPEERSARVRAIFLYAVLLVTLIPVAQNVLSLLIHLILQLLDLNPLQTLLGGDQVWSENMVAILANLVAAAYFYRVLQRDWQSGINLDAFVEIRRLYRYLWLAYGLGLIVFGLQQLIQFIFLIWDAMGEAVQVMLANGLALLLVGLPLWVYTERLIQRSQVDAPERDSLLRLVALYILVFISLIGCLAAVSVFFYEVLRILLGGPFEIFSFLAQIAGPLSLAAPLGIVWAYYGRSLGVELKGLPDQLSRPAPIAQSETEPDVRVEIEREIEKDRQRRAGLRRLYFYILAFLGLLAMFVGLQYFLAGLLDLAFGERTLGVAALRDQLAAALAALLVGLPLWLIAWRPMVKEAVSAGEMGDFARRSLIRKSYLYLLLFLGVLGVMFSAGMLIYQLIRALLGETFDSLLLAVLQQIKTLAIFAALLVYHWLALRLDSRLAEGSLSRRYAQYPVLILAPDENDFCDMLVKALQNQAPELPVAVHLTSQGAPGPDLSAARAVILPQEFLIRPGEALRLWLQSYQGERLILTIPSKGWYWIPGSQKGMAALARQTAQMVQKLAEGRDITPPRENSALMLLVYILAGLFALELAFLLITIMVSLFFR